MFTIFNRSQGYNPDTAYTAASLEEAAMTLLGHDHQSCGLERNRHGDLEPWRRPHRGEVEYLSNLARETEAEVWRAIVDDEHFALEAVTDAELAVILGDIEA